jgi:hypothetical protein
MMVEAKDLAEKGVQVPAKELGPTLTRANPSPSPDKISNRVEGGHSKASAAHQGREECPEDPRNQAVGPP